MTLRRSVFPWLLAAPAAAGAGPIALKFTQLGYLQYPEAVSNRGLVVAGNDYHGVGWATGHRLYGGMVYGVSGDGRTVVGESFSFPVVHGNTNRYWPIEWENRYGAATAVSADGRVAVGNMSAPTTDGALLANTQAFRWLESDRVELLPGLAGAKAVSAAGVSADGRVVVGYSDGTPVRWTFDGGAPRAEALDLVGDVRQTLAGEWAFLYRDGGLERFRDMLVALTSDPTELASLAKYEFQTAAVSPDGTAVTGWANKNGHPRGYLAVFDRNPFATGPGGGGEPVGVPEPGAGWIAAAACGAGLALRRRAGRIPDVP